MKEINKKGGRFMAAKKTQKTVETAKEESKELLKEVAEKAEPVVTKAKKAAKSAAKAAEPVLEAAKNAGKQVTAVFVPEVYVQHANRQFDCGDLINRCKDDFKAKHKNTVILSCKLYIKPEDNMVYYVINDIEDKLPL